MKILLTGGGSGGHFYPLIAVAESINRFVAEKNIIPPKLYFMSDSQYDADILLKNKINFVFVPTGKLRRYFSILNISDIFKTIIGIIIAVIKLFIIYPDVIFSKGAYASFPVLIAARFLCIPIVIHESDSVPGRTNLWSGKFAKRIAISYPEAANYFKNKNRIAYTGHPIRYDLMKINEKDPQYFKLDNNKPVILVLGGSLGAKIINDVILDSLSKLIEKYQIIHQTGKNNIEEVKNMAELILKNSPNKEHYKAFDYLNDFTLIKAVGVADLIITRAGSAIFEIANWGIPSIVIPITDTNGDHQRKNAYTYGRTGSATIIEEANLAPNLIIEEIDRILQNEELKNKMSDSAKKFNQPDANDKIAKEIMNIALSHEK